MDFDTYLERETNKYLEEQEMHKEVSSCCGAAIIDETDMCSACKEHCSEVEIGDYIFDQMANEAEEKADYERELRRDNND